MAGQLAQYGAEYIGNKVSGLAQPFVGASHPASWIVGQEWINTTGSTVNVYDPSTSAWVAGPYNGYMCLLTADPTTVVSGGPAVNISDLSTIEDTTSGYQRQYVTWGSAAVSEPSAILNSNQFTFGPYTANQAAAIGWAAFILVPAANSTAGSPIASTVHNGLLMYMWQVPNPQQVLSTQSITIAANTFDIGIS